MRVMAAKDGVLIRRRLRIFAAAVALVLLCAVCVGSASAWSADTTWGADYDSASVFYIEDADDLAQFASLVNGGKNFAGKRVVLNADIDLSNHQEWVSIGTSTRPFAGTFDGNGHSISGMYQYLESFLFWGEVGGLFGYVSGTITDLTVTDSTVEVESNPTIGLIVGVLQGGNVNNCKVSSSSIISSDWGWLGMSIFGCTIGGVVGKNEGGVVYDSVTMEGVNFPRISESWLGTIYNNDIVGNGELTPDDTNATFEITATTDGYGTITPSGTITVAKGSSVTYGFEPYTGYTLKTVTVDGTDVTAACLASSSYTFTDIKKDYTISVTYQLALTYKITIPDELVLSTDTHTGEMKITAEELYIPEAGEVRVTVSSTHDFNLAYVADEDVLLSYQASVVVDGEESVLSAENNEAAAFTMEEFTALSSELPESTMTAEVTGSPVYAGIYQDTLTFTAQYIES